MCSRIWYDFECEKLLNLDPKGLGIRSTKKTKLEGNLTLKKYIENGWLKINDSETITELSRYEEVSPNVYHANTQDGADDRVTSIIWGIYYINSDYFDEDTGTSSMAFVNKDNRIQNSEEKPVFFSSNDFVYDLPTPNNNYYF